eukprot:TRINITY_DN6834_c0_g1_i1.p1 TRINITY_DN6834_c0_g1~~TRINITY_DN6834_c0_g1_i1.p1  ORF type:complete len:257 (+),score=67.93 TRINITY_DN6834_c0_g1_i1:131-901(+)
MACLQVPFEAANEAQLATKIKAGRIHKIPSSYSDSIARIIYSMIQVDMTKRPQITDLLRLPQSSSRLASLPTYKEVAHKLPSNITVQVSAAANVKPANTTAEPAPVAKAAPAPAPVTRAAAPAPVARAPAPAPVARAPAPAPAARPTTARDDTSALDRRKCELDQREAQLRLREKAVEKREAECDRREKKSADGRPATAGARATVPAFNDKENPVSAKQKLADDTSSVKPLQPLQNIYDRREKLLARLLNHRIGSE